MLLAGLDGMESVLKAWRGLNWEDLQSRIDAEIKAIGDRQEDGEQAKKVLVDESNKYRKNTTKESRKVAVPLIKTFQTEVDRLTTRGRVSEAALIDICSFLTNIPDPLPILEQAPAWKSLADKANTAIEEADQLKKTVSDLHSEFADLKNQDVTLRQLREKIRELEEQKTQEVDQCSSATEERLRAEFAETESEMNMRSDKLREENSILEKKISELENRLRESQRKMDSAKMAADQRESLEFEHINILTKDLELSSRRVASLELEVEKLSGDLATAQRNAKRGGLEDIAALGGLMKEKDDQIALLRESNKSLSDRLEGDRQKMLKEIETLNADLEVKNSAIAELEKALTDKSDYDAIKQELRLLREIEFGEAAEANEDAINRLGETVQSLDRLLAEKNRRLQNENAHMRVSIEKKTGDDIMQAIVAGSHSMVVDTVTKQIGRKLAQRYHDPEVDSALETEIAKSKEERKTAQAEQNDSQNLFKILMNMGKPPPSTSPPTPLKRERSPSEIPFDQFRYSPKLTNYTGEASKSPQELKAISDLQIRVNQNIRDLGPRALNTSEIARQCKRLMVAYNIGQRLFAKYVMNQSQGSLSELLSKPRHWAKLTDKGREAFRRIYGWISDDRAIDLLCSLSPRRAWPNDIDQKISHPTCESLWESNSGNLPPDEIDENKNTRRAASAREDQYRLAGTPHAANSGSSQRNSRWRHDDIPKEKIMSIFQTELAKIREQESNLERAITSRTFGNGHVRRMDDLNSPYHEMSPTERMAAVNHAHQVMTARMKTGLAPITQEQFEEFGHIDTEDVVRQIKDFLSMNSISQRQFGEHVLGLSQGSVSDLLARPKQWHMLTQKGREPFIRMKLFMKEVIQTAENARRQELNDSTTDSNDDENLVIADMSKVKQEIEEILPVSALDCQIADEADDPDTSLLVRRVKDRLHLHGISQRLFGEFVLGISPGGCSEMFLRPKPWSSLNNRGREPYEKMISWLKDKEGVDKLLAREKLEIANGEKINENGKRSADPPYEPPPRKVQRTVISDQQKEALRFVFDHEHHPSQKTVELLALKLSLNVRTVNNWFHNHRTRQKANFLKDGGKSSSESPVYQRSKNWQEDLASMLENVARSGYEDHLPTMVPLPNLFGGDSGSLNTDAEVRDSSDDNEKPPSSQLDKAVERMRQLASRRKEEKN